MALTIRDITCHDAVALVGDYLEGALTWRQRRRLERHLRDCDACAGYLEQMRQTIALTGKVRPEDLEPETMDGIMRLFDQYRGENPRRE